MTLYHCALTEEVFEKLPYWISGDEWNLVIEQAINWLQEHPDVIASDDPDIADAAINDFLEVLVPQHCDWQWEVFYRLDLCGQMDDLLKGAEAVNPSEIAAQTITQAGLLLTRVVLEAIRNQIDD
jgi:hypothetical protein